MYKKLLALSLALLLTLSGCGTKGILDPKDPTTITIWHYYNSRQQQAFDALVDTFNQTVGKEKGIIVASFSQGGVKELTANVTASANKDVGAQPMPDIFASYSDTAYAVDKLGMVADIGQFLTPEEQSQYIESYIDEGKFTTDGSIKIFPIAKSTEALMINKTQWDAFKDATGVDETSLSTWEGIVEVSKKYYEWTDSLTPKNDDGKAFFGRDAVANYFLVGSMQLGTEIFEVSESGVTFNIDKAAMKKLWDNFYVPYVNGYFGAYGRFRSDDVKTGLLVACVGSTSSASYFPDAVTYEDGTTTKIERAVLPLPNFANAPAMAVQQGAGMVVSKSDEKKEYAAVEFLKWFTAVEQNIEFSVMAGYMPVKKEAATKEAFDSIQSSADLELNTFTNEIITTSLDIAQNYKLYTSKAFKDGNAARNIFEFSVTDLANKNLVEIEALVASGVSRSEAASCFTTEKDFEEWVSAVNSSLAALK